MCTEGASYAFVSRLDLFEVFELFQAFQPVWLHAVSSNLQCNLIRDPLEAFPADTLARWRKHFFLPTVCHLKHSRYAFANIKSLVVWSPFGRETLMKNVEWHRPDRPPKEGRQSKSMQ